MILGLGSDIVNIERIIKMLDRFGVKAEKRLLTENELADLNRINKLNIIGRASFIAKRFAAKEACAKAIGTGFRDGITLTDFEISHTDNGKPIVLVHGKAAEFIKIKLSNNINIKFDISLSDDYPLAQAIVIISSADNPLNIL